MSANSATGGFLELSPAPGLKDAEDVLHDIIAAVTGLPGELVRPAAQAEPPRAPDAGVNWCSFGIVKCEPFGFPEIRHNGAGEGHDEIIRHEEIAVRVSLYGPDHLDLAWALCAGFHVPQNRASLRPSGLAFVRAGSILRLPVPLGAGIRSRADLTLTFRRVTARSAAVLNLKATTGKITNHDGVAVPL